MTNRVTVYGKSFEQVKDMARKRSLEPEYQGCGVYVNAAVRVAGYDNSIAHIEVSFVLSGFFSDSTLVTIVNGKERI